MKQENYYPNSSERSRKSGSKFTRLRLRRGIQGCADKLESHHKEDIMLPQIREMRRHDH